MTKPTIEIHIITYNEEIMLPFTITHYRRMFGDPKFIIHDNCSTDDTVMLAHLAGATVVPFVTDGMNDTEHRWIKSRAAMEATADWVLVLDCDECCYIDTNDLIALEEHGVNAVHFSGYDIFDDQPTPWDAYKAPRGCGSPGYSKPVLLRTGQFKEIEYGAGAHKLDKLIPLEGKEINWGKDEFKLIHYKHWSPKWHLDRSHELGIRQSEENKRMGYSGHFAYPDSVHTNWFTTHYALSEPIIDRHI